MSKSEPTAQEHGVARSRADRSLAWAALIGIALFAVAFAKERLYADGAYFLIQVIKTEGFHVINGRWLIPLIQWLPLTGVHLGLSMEALIVLFSLANVALAALLYLFSVRVLRDREAGLMLVATQFVGLTHALFCPIFEFYYGAMLLVLFVSVQRNTTIPRLGRVGLLSVLFLLVASSHFMGLLVLLFVLVLERIWQDKQLTIILSVLLIALLAHRLVFLSTYESDAFEHVFWRLENWGVLWIFAPGRLMGHMEHTLFHYPDTLALGALAAVVMLRAKDFRGLVLYLGGLFTMYVLISLYYPDATHERYREILDYSPTAWTLLVILMRVIHMPGARPWVLGLLAVTLVLRLAWSTHVGRTYSERTAWMEERIADARSMKVRRAVVLDQETFLPPGNRVRPLEPLSVNEVLLLSACQGPGEVIVLVPLKKEQLRSDLTSWLDVQFATYGTELPTDPNGHYFHMVKDEFVVLPQRVD